MKSPISFIAAIPVLLALFAQTAHAEDSWSKTVAFSRSEASAIKVFEPENYRASVTIGDNTSGDTVPTVLQVPNSDAFYTVTITAPNGATWQTKVETKKNAVTELRIKHIASNTTNAPARKYFGKLRPSKQKETLCTFDDVPNAAARIDFVDSAGTTVVSKRFNGTAISVEVPAGEYEIRTFRLNPGEEPVYRNTRKGTVTADGWQAAVFCPPSGVDIQFYSK